MWSGTGHHRAGGLVALAGPVEAQELEIDAGQRAGGLDCAQPLGHDLVADAVAGDHRYSVLRHLPCLRRFLLRRNIADAPGRSNGVRRTDVIS
jgi:hypothetical protein